MKKWVGLTSYAQTALLVGSSSLPLAGRNSHGEAVVIERGSDRNLGSFYRVTTSQDNGWCRINTYYENGLQEETYHR